jgi:hypothetical protein
MVGQVSAVLRNFEYGLEHWCPGCESMHFINIDAPNPQRDRWEFNGDIDCPTFSPSINISYPDPDGEFPDERCHYFITAGQIQFCADSTHALAGQTVPLPPLPAAFQDRC